MYYNTTDNRKLFYEIAGSPEAETTLLFLNGLSQTTKAWAGVVAGLPNYHIVLVDLLFQGQSDKLGPHRSFDAHADDVAGLIAEKLADKKVIVCGLSYGGVVAQHIAFRHPEKIQKLVLMATFAHKTPWFDAVELSWNKALALGGWPLMLDIMLPYVLSPNYFSHPVITIEAIKSLKQQDGLADALKKLMQATKERPDYRPYLKKVKTPTLVIAGQQDLLFPVSVLQELSKSIAGSKLEVVAGVGHTLNLEAISQLVQIIHRFAKI